MQITTKGHYALNAVLDIALNQKYGPVSLISVSENQAISLSYLEQLVSKLRKAGIVKSVRGPGGGYYLNNEMEKISIFDVVSAVDENLNINKCRGYKNCKSGSVCLTHHLWQGLTYNLQGYLKNITIADVCDDSKMGEGVIKNNPFNIKI